MDVAGRLGRRAEGGWAGIEERAEDVGDGGARRCGRALQDQDGIGTGGRQGGMEPRHAVGEMFRGEVEDFAELLYGIALRSFGTWKRAGGAGGAKGGSEILGDVPAGGVDFDGFALVVVEIEEDGSWGQGTS